MKILVFILPLVLYSCSASPYRLNDYEKSRLKGFNRNQAEKIVNTNQKNRQVNEKAARKNQENISKDLNKTNSQASAKVKKPKKHSGVFKHYWY